MTSSDRLYTIKHKDVTGGNRCRHHILTYIYPLFYHTLFILNEQ